MQQNQQRQNAPFPMGQPGANPQMFANQQMMNPQFQQQMMMQQQAMQQQFSG